MPSGKLAELLLQAISEELRASHHPRAQPQQSRPREGAHESAPDDCHSIDRAIARMDDYVGYRPVATLENHDGQPYRHEFVCPIPLFVKGAGIAAGPYAELLRLAIESLRRCDPAICRAASFDLGRMQELSLDPRAYDFDHPVNRRPNYHFGGWDDRRVDAEGYFDRFVVRRVMLDSLLEWIDSDAKLPREEALVEAASVLGGTILMASGISGWGPGAYSSDVTLSSLMKPIAAYRDSYYTDRLAQIDGVHGDRLRREAKQRHQPFGGIRQHLNAALARRRATQLQHVQLARLYARMGYPGPATKQADRVAAASSRLMCRIDCALTLGLRALRDRDLSEAAEVPDRAFGLLRRAIDCGALIDPWNILGFGGNFGLYPGPESAVHDSRVDDLLYLVEQLFSFIAKVWSEAAARDDAQVYDAMEGIYRDIADWWRQFAAHTVDSIEAIDPLESYDSAKLVARALRYWHQGGAAAGDVRFWAGHAEWFDSPRAYALVISALLERNDFAASMALLVHWMSAADRVGLRSGGSSLSRLSERWLLRLRDHFVGSHPNDETASVEPAAKWVMARRFFDHLEANAEEFWSSPKFRIGDPSRPKRDEADWESTIEAVDGDDSEASLYDAAYENMTYRDTTDDGVDGSVFDAGGGDEGNHDELETESKRLVEHLNFLQSLARMWSVAADVACERDERLAVSPVDAESRLNHLRSWAGRARQNRIGLLELLDSVRAYRIEPSGSDKESMRAYDRLRVLRDSLMERIIGAAVEMADARRLISGVIAAMTTEATAEEGPPDPGLPGPKLPQSDPLGEDPLMTSDAAAAVQMLGDLIGNRTEVVRATFSEFVAGVSGRSLLYIPLSRGGDPVKIFVARLRQRLFHHLLQWLPRRGLIVEACQLAEAARQMEQNHPIGNGAVTEFDSLFEVGFQSLVSALVDSTELERSSDAEGSSRGTSVGVGVGDGGDVDDEFNGYEHDQNLVSCLERLTEVLLGSWLAHSQTLRLSPLELVGDEKKWSGLVAFVREYGDPIFTQTFLQLGNVRAILHQGVGNWLRRVIQEGDPAWEETALVRDLAAEKLPMSEAERWITLVYESLIDHHAEYMDYNSTTTQSDRGELVYTFLDFLRLRVRYERIAWNLKPVMWAHDVLVRRGMDVAASRWRESLNERIGREAELYVQRLRQLQTRYAMRMPTVADRIAERFVRPMTIDRMRALVGPAMRDAEAGCESAAFEALQTEADALTMNPCGVGLDVPQWLDSLEEEVERIAKTKIGSEIDPTELVRLRPNPLPMAAWDEELITARRLGRRLPHMEDDSET